MFAIKYNMNSIEDSFTQLQKIIPMYLVSLFVIVVGALKTILNISKYNAFIDFM